MAEHRRLLLTGSSDCLIGMWDIFNNFTLVQQYRQSSDEPLTSLVSVDQRYFVTSCNKGSLKIWDSLNHSLASNKLNAHHARVNSLNLLSKYRILSCSADKTARVWQLQGTNMQKLADLIHTANVVSAVELESADMVAVVTQLGYVSIWDL